MICVHVSHPHAVCQIIQIHSFITHSLTRLVQASAQTLALNSRFSHFLYIEDSASILRLFKSGEQKSIRLREGKHAASNTGTSSHQQWKTGLSSRIAFI